MVLGWVANWKKKTDKDIADLKLEVANNYVKKADLKDLDERIEAQFGELRASQNQILDVLLKRPIGTTGRRKQ